MSAPQDNLPPYRFGIDPGPHPTRHPDGHSFGRAERLDDRAAFERGVRLFDHGYYWEAHEAWEGAWRRAATDAPERDLWQALILIAAAALKRARGEPAAVERLARKARERIARAEREGGRQLFDVTAVQIAGLADRLTQRVASPLRVRSR